MTPSTAPLVCLICWKWNETQQTLHCSTIDSLSGRFPQSPGLSYKWQPFVLRTIFYWLSPPHLLSLNLRHGLLSAILSPYSLRLPLIPVKPESTKASVEHDPSILSIFKPVLQCFDFTMRWTPESFSEPFRAHESFILFMRPFGKLISISVKNCRVLDVLCIMSARAGIKGDY